MRVKKAVMREWSWVGDYTIPAHIRLARLFWGRLPEDAMKCSGPCSKDEPCWSCKSIWDDVGDWLAGFGAHNPQAKRAVEVLAEALDPRFDEKNAVRDDA